MDIAVAALQAYVWYLYAKTVELLGDNWSTAAGSFNHGQLVIFVQYLNPVLEEWMGNAAQDWPYVDAEEYQAEMMSAYDMEVMDRAFSDTVSRPVPQMDENIVKAVQAQARADFLDAVSSFMDITGGLPGGLGGKIARSLF